MRRGDALLLSLSLVLFGCGLASPSDRQRASTGGKLAGEGTSDGATLDAGGATQGDGLLAADAGGLGDAGVRADVDAGGDGAAPPLPLDVPEGAHCAAVASWDPQWAQFEEEVLALANEARSQGHDCDSEGTFGPASPLTMEPRLRCAARLHTKYMATTGDFGHTESANGSDPFERTKAAGYTFRAAGENIAAGPTTPQDVVNGWLESDGHCRNIMDASFTDIGIGYVPTTKSIPAVGSIAYPYWTQNFAAPW